MIKSRLDAVLEEKEIRVTDLIETSKLSRDTVFRAKRDSIESCTLSTLETIAKALGVKVKDLFEETDDIKEALIVTKFDVTLLHFGGGGETTITIEIKSANVTEEDVKDILNRFLEDPDMQPFTRAGHIHSIKEVVKHS